jgi:ribonuclease HII
MIEGLEPLLNSAFQPAAGHGTSEVMPPDIQWELQSGYPKILVAGIDEVGRGCLAGPVVACALILPSEIDYVKHPWILRVQDSKKLTPEVREELAPLIENWAEAFAIGVATVEEIDRINIHHACHLAMLRAVEELKSGKKMPDRILLDGKFIPKEFQTIATAIVKGDDKCLSIAAASVVAKVWRDRHMRSLDGKFPGYDFGVHKGYGTPMHKAALARLGPCEIHRRSFAPVAELMAEVSQPSWF